MGYDIGCPEGLRVWVQELIGVFVDCVRSRPCFFRRSTYSSDSWESILCAAKRVVGRRVYGCKGLSCACPQTI